MIIRLKPAPPHHPGHPAHRPDRLAAPLTNVIDHLHFHDNRHHPEMQKVGDTGDISLLFFLLVLIFGPFWVIFGPF